MSDLVRVLPTFPVAKFAHLLPAVERHGLTTAELLILDPADIGKRTHLPLIDIRRFCAAIRVSLQDDLGLLKGPPLRPRQTASNGEPLPGAVLRHTHATLAAQWHTISTLDPLLDRALNGGIPAGHITEVTGESGAGKTQLLLTLLLAVQLPAPHGLGKPALYISTEAPLATRRLTQMLAAHPLLRDMTDDAARPSLDNIMSTNTPDLESQEHILTYQVPVEIERRGIGLLVIDSVAANFRAEFDRTTRHSANMGARATDLNRLGMLLHDIARKYNVAVVVANQVADRFARDGGRNSYKGGGMVFKTPGSPALRLIDQHSATTAQRRPMHQSRFGRATQESPLATRSRDPNVAGPTSSSVPAEQQGEEPVTRSSMPVPAPEFAPEDAAPWHPALTLDHQQRWFTGWGDEPGIDHGLKTPSLGLVWATQISGRIALLKRPAWGQSRFRGDDEDPNAGVGMPTLRQWRRWMKVVFAPHAPASGPGDEAGVEFEVGMGGLKGLPPPPRKKEVLVAVVGKGKARRRVVR